MTATALERHLCNVIATHGPLTMARYMAETLGHPEHGYYMTRDPFGAAGDFITAPEISQMFGELIGAWCADVWMQMGVYGCLMDAYICIRMPSLVPGTKFILGHNTFPFIATFV